MRILKALGLLLAVLVLAGLGYLFAAPPDPVRVGANYAAKIVCSNVFLAGRNAREVLAVDVQAPGHWLLTLMRVDVDEEAGTVRTGLFGLFGGGLAVYRPGQGCSSVPQGGVARLVEQPAPDRAPPPVADAPWPEGSRVEPPVNEALDAVLNDPGLTGPGMRAVVVVKDGTIVGERYAEGFAPEMPLLGWSVSKTVSGALIGRAVREGRLDLGQTASFEGWDGDGRAEITVRDMMGMAPDLAWNEGYGTVSDVTRMLYLETDMAGFVAGQPRDGESPEGIGEVFEYSSGTTVLLSRLWQDAFDDPAEAAVWPYAALFDPLGMSSAVMEMDASGTFVGSSYIYATARDWARFGQFMLQRGVWNGRSVLPVGFVDWMVTAHPASDGVYGNGQTWLRPANASMEGPNPELPEDGFYMSGHDGQSINVVPSEGLVVVRLGLTPIEERYKVAFLVHAVIAALDP